MGTKQFFLLAFFPNCFLIKSNNLLFLIFLNIFKSKRPHKIDTFKEWTTLGSHSYMWQHQGEAEQPLPLLDEVCFPQVSLSQISLGLCLFYELSLSRHLSLWCLTSTSSSLPRTQLKWWWRIFERCKSIINKKIREEIKRDFIQFLENRKGV